MPRKRRVGRRASVLRNIRTGTQRKSNEGDILTCLVLASGSDEWVGVDLATGALVRNRPSLPGSPSPLLSTDKLDVVTITLANDDEPIDPGRPEAISVREATTQPRKLKHRTVRRLLQNLCVPEIPYSAILGARGPSIAYVDLDGKSPSLAIIEASAKQMEAMTDERGVVVSLTWCGTTQVLPIIDSDVVEVARKAAPRSLGGSSLIQSLAMKPGFTVIGLLGVSEGHAKKAVFSVLPR